MLASNSHSFISFKLNIFFIRLPPPTSAVFSPTILLMSESTLKFPLLTSAPITSSRFSKNW